MLVDSSYACRPGQGRPRRRARVQRNLRRWPWFVKVDSTAYFPSIDHAPAEGAAGAPLQGHGLPRPARAHHRCRRPGTPGRGLPIGALTSQHFANAYLDAGRPLAARHAACAPTSATWTTSSGGAPSRDAAVASLEDLRVFLWRERRLRLKPGAASGVAPQRAGVLRLSRPPGRCAGQRAQALALPRRSRSDRCCCRWCVRRAWRGAARA